MAQYRSLNRPAVQRVHVKVHKPSSKHIQPQQISQVKPIHTRPTSPRAAIEHTKTPQIHPVKPVQQPKQTNIKSVRTQVVKLYTPKRLEVGKQRGTNQRAQSDKLLAYRDGVARLRGSGAGKTLVIIACGPSILEAQIERLKGHQKIDLMCINKPDKRVWPTQYWAFCDQSQYARNKDAWESYNGTIINASSVRARHKNQVLIKSLSGVGFSKDLFKGYHIGRSSTYAALQVALWMSYDKIYIFGVDMCAVDGKLHFYGQNPDVANDTRIKRFEREAESYLYAAAHALTADDRRKIIICSSYNNHKFVEYFGRLHQSKAVEVILDCNK